MLLFKEVVPGVKLLKTPFCGSWSGVILIKGDKKLFPYPGFKFKQIFKGFLNRLDQHGKNNQKSNKGNP